MSSQIISVAVPVPLYQLFDYLAPIEDPLPQPGSRVAIPFGHRQLIGIVWDNKQESLHPQKQLKPIIELIDETPVLSQTLRHYCQWLSQYYHHPLGEVCFTVLPSLLRKNCPAQLKTEQHYRLTEAGEKLPIEALNRAPKQQQLFKLLGNKTDPVLTPAELTTHQINRSTINSLIKKNLIELFTPEPCQTQKTIAHLTLNQPQQLAVEAISKTLNSFQAFLLQGVTASGKTEVYLHLIDQVIQQNQQALVLVPEISLTPQTIARFTERFGNICLALHSGLTERGRLNGWLQAKKGQAKIIIGTRSAIFTDLANPGIIIIDEEHDLSFKQQEGLRYSARDFAILRAQQESIPIVLGSATPSLESLYNTQSHFTLLHLPTRATQVLLPRYDLIDLRQQQLTEGLSQPLLNKIDQHLNNKQQVLLFLNRRGFAPVLLCHECGWVGQCPRCNQHYTLHQREHKLICHHCDKILRLPKICPDCQSETLIPVGVGTQRLEEQLKEQFPDTPVLRIDRDSTRKKHAFTDLFNEIKTGKPQILVGTQMVTKGHHFPNVSLVGIINADNGFFSSDFRAVEKMGQLIVQVAGRAGRENKQGEVVIQTHQPHHPLLQQLINQGYEAFAQTLLTERQTAQLPPFSYLAMFRAEGINEGAPKNFLQQLKELAQPLKNSALVLGPTPAPMPKRAGKFRAQLLLHSQNRKTLHQTITHLIQQINQYKLGKQVRWSIDVDPMEIY